jgi:hypothetical protein
VMQSQRQSKPLQPFKVFDLSGWKVKSLAYGKANRKGNPRTSVTASNQVVGYLRTLRQAHRQLMCREASANEMYERLNAFDSFHDRHRHLPSSTCRLLVTEKTPETLLACISAICLSICLATAPSRVTLPFFTIMCIGGTARNSY